MDEIDDITRAWIRNPSDEAAAANGCRFDEDRGRVVCEWIERYCHLYEGSRELMKLLDWEREVAMRLFGWQRWGTNLPSGNEPRWIRRFTRAVVFVPKKNGKSPFLAALSLYLMAGDGEQGNHIFFAAADGGQARIAAKHAVEMVKASADLHDEQGGEIKINLNEMRMTHLPSGSDAKPISSGDKRAAQAKQGLNGSVCIDELHVVTREFISESSIDRAGSSRDEPLLIAVSTAGKDPDSYGRQQYEYGKQVESGEVNDQAFFFLCFEAPQDLADHDLEADPCKWGRMANPAWGRLTREDEFLADYNRSKRSIADLADFKTFRLDIWQQAASPWLRAGDWLACRGKFSAEDMAGKPCCMGLDLAKTRDMTALVLCFPWEEGKYRLVPFFFLPEAGVRRLAVNFPKVLDWSRAGHLIETPGEVTDYLFLKSKVREITSKVRVESVVYDEHNAEEITQWIQEELGIIRVEFAQNITTFNAPTKDFERDVICGNIEHDGNPVMSWQIGHCQVKTDNNANKRPVKPKPGDDRKIDGVVAGIMARAGATKIERVWYVAGQGM